MFDKVDYKTITKFPEVKIIQSITHRYTNIKSCRFHNKIDLLDELKFEQILKGRISCTEDFLHKQYSLYIGCNGLEAWNVIYALIDNILMVYCYEGYNENSEPKKYNLSAYNLHRYDLHALYKINKEVMIKFDLLGTSNITPNAFFKLINSDKVERLA